MKKFLTVQVVRPSDAQCMPTVITAHNSKEDARAQMETLFHQTRRKYGTVLWTEDFGDWKCFETKTDYIEIFIQEIEIPE